MKVVQQIQNHLTLPSIFVIPTSISVSLMFVIDMQLFSIFMIHVALHLAIYDSKFKH